MFRKVSYAAGIVVSAATLLFGSPAQADPCYDALTRCAVNCAISGSVSCGVCTSEYQQCINQSGAPARERPRRSREIVKTIEIPSESPWTDTGVMVSEGDVISIQVRGTVVYADPDDEHVTGPEGTSSESGCSTVVTDPRVPAHSVVGNVAGSPTLDGRGFYVGSSFDSIVPIYNTTSPTGRLYLGFNDGAVFCDRTGYDSWGFGGDNHGSFTAEITITRRQHSRARPPTTVTSTIYAEEVWTPTGVFVDRGQRISIRAWGEAAIDTDGARASPGGSGRGRASSRALVPGAPKHGLVCRVGGDYPFFVGHRTTIRAGTGGELRCGMNEDPAIENSYWDNSGEWTAEIVVR